MVSRERAAGRFPKKMRTLQRFPLSPALDAAYDTGCSGSNFLFARDTTRPCIPNETTRGGLIFAPAIGFIMNIFVGNISYETTEEEIRQAFQAHGEVTSAAIIMDRATGRSKGFGFVEMSDPVQAKAAIAALNLKEFHGRALTVNEARPKGAGGSSTRENGNRHGW